MTFESKHGRHDPIYLEPPSDFPTFVTTAVEDLSWSHDGGTQGVAPVTAIPDAWPSVTSWQLNTVGNRFVFKVTGTDSFGGVFASDIYSDANFLDEEILPRFGFWAARAYVDEADNHDTAWTYGIQARGGNGGTLFLSDLDPAESYWIEIEPTHFPFSINQTRHYETLRQDAAGRESGEFWKLTGLITNDGATFQTVTFTEPIVYIATLGDSINSGFITPVSGDATVAHISASQYYASVTTVHPTLINWHAAGAQGGFSRLCAEAFADSAGKRLITINLSRPGQWEADMGPIIGAYHTTNVGAGRYNDYSTRFKYILLTSIDWTDSGHWTGGVTPKLFVIGTFANDMLQRATEMVAGILAVGMPFDNYFGGGTTIADKVAKRAGPSLIYNIRNHASFSSPPNILLVGPSFTDTGHLAAPLDLTTRANLEPAFEDSVTYYDFQPAGADYSWGAYMAISDMGTSIPDDLNDDAATYSLHPSIVQQFEIKAALQTEFDRLAT